MTTVTTLRENCGDILADAKAINEERAAAACEEIADTAEEPAQSLPRPESCAAGEENPSRLPGRRIL